MKTQKAVHILIKFTLILVIFFGLNGRVIARYADGFFHKGASTEIGNLKTPMCRAKVMHCRLLCFEQDFLPVILPTAGFKIDLVPPVLVVVQAYQVLYTTKSLSGHEFRLLPLRAPPYC
ncbi:hypothetical protein HDE69_002802 [Pedobacter cryoconitis]|uniref:Uncharacterized protein n=1 Tax=Pedobacter cryoconitis TaxID=188932 RepID=A0A7W8YTY1_9SPHI|nr:hypothetical protein [Pedobacter cryoconitis]MBB5621739.1 hypothetical protein [Pedobacter cryoconitis]MBB5644141.1 hypothetical protein [Pedobacter cryoconitis]